MDILGQSSLLVGVTSFALGFSTLAKNVRNKLFLAFALICTLVSLWALSFFLEIIWGGGVFYRLHLYLNAWLAPAALAFVRVMVRNQDHASRRLFDASVLLSLALSVALTFGFERVPWVKNVIYFSPGLIVLQILILMAIDRRIVKGVRMIPKLPTVGLGRKRNLIYVGGLLVLSTSVMDHVPWIGREIPAIGNLGLVVYLFFISQAITQQRLLNLGALLSRFLVLLAVALTLSAVYAVLVAWIENSPGLFFLNSFIASFIILMLLDPLRTLVRYATQRLLTQKHQRLEMLLEDSQRRLTGIVDPGALFQSVLFTAMQTLQPEWAGLFVLRGDGTQFRRVRTDGTEPDPESAARVKELLVNHPLLQYCEKRKRRGELPVVLDQVLENEIDRLAGRSQRENLRGLLQSLKALGGNLLIPLFDSSTGSILGFVVMDVARPPEPWENSWGLLQIIYPYFEQAAETLRNLEVYVRSREKERLAALGEMAAGLAHEIRNPLGAIKGAAQFLDPSADRPESRFLRVIVEEVDRLNRVVTQFLDYSKPSTVEFKKVELSELARKTVDLMRNSLPSGVKLEFQASSGAYWIEAAPEQIQQVILNLIQNSFNAVSKRPSGEVRVSVRSSGEEVFLDVEDDGHGIKKENLDKLFIPFFTTSPSGTGLGLSICQKIVENHRGRMDVVSEEGKLTRFTVILPAAISNAVDLESGPR